MRFDGPVVEIGEISEVSDGDLAVETCMVRALPPAVTLEQGIERIREAVEALKLDPPTCSSGFLRFQVGFGSHFWIFLSKSDGLCCEKVELSVNFFCRWLCLRARKL